jgi:Papain family cysteine protease
MCVHIFPNFCADIVVIMIPEHFCVLQSYVSGVLAVGCGGEADVGHCIQVVGYTLDHPNLGSYWIVRNSWTTQWGIDGYIYLAYVSLFAVPPLIPAALFTRTDPSCDCLREITRVTSQDTPPTPRLRRDHSVWRVVFYPTIPDAVTVGWLLK